MSDCSPYLAPQTTHKEMRAKWPKQKSWKCSLGAHEELIRSTEVRVLNESDSPSFLQDLVEPNWNTYYTKRNTRKPFWMFDEGTQQYESSRKRKRNLGRSARRRRKKVIEVEAAALQAAQQECGGDGAESQDDNGNMGVTGGTAKEILPSDRHYVLPTIEKERALTERDDMYLVNQLGYLPGNALSVAARIRDIPGLPGKDVDAPVVLRLYPVAARAENEGRGGRQKARKRSMQKEEGAAAAAAGGGGIDDHKNESADRDAGAAPQLDHVATSTQMQTQAQTPTASSSPQLLEPFPTIFWVTHPLAKALISKLELESFGKELEQRLQTDAEALQSMQVAHAAYGQARHAMIHDADWIWIRQRKWEAAFGANRGVAGIRNTRSIKCLHAHTAHYWSGCEDNVVGRWVTERLQTELATMTIPKKTGK